MAHLPSYKSFNFHDVEEIEQRIFSPTPAKSDKELKTCPGSLHIQDEMNRKAAHHENIHSSKWDHIQHSIYNILHHKPRDSLVVHVNANFSEELTAAEDSSEDESVIVTHQAHTSKVKKKGRTKSDTKLEAHKLRPKITMVNVPENLDLDEIPERKSWKYYICCQCTSRRRI